MTTTHETVTAEYWLISLKSSRYVNGEHLFDAWFDHDKGRWNVEFDVHTPTNEATMYPTRAAAVDSFIAYHLDPRRVAITHVPAVTRLTAEGRAANAARRAARNADRHLVPVTFGIVR